MCPAPTASWIALAAGAFAAQGVSGAESALVLASAAGTSGADAGGALYELQQQVGAGLAGSGASGTTFDWALGLPALGASFAPPAPVAFGLVPHYGDRLGGASTRLLGFGFANPAISSTTVQLGALVASASGPASNTYLDLVTPPGVNGFGNPLGPVDVAVITDLGASLLPDGYAYSPALLAGGPAAIGCPFAWRYFGASSSWGLLATGGSVPGTAIAVPPLGGALELAAFVIPLTAAKFAPAGELELTYTLPSNPSLVGLAFEFQMVGLTSLAPLEGSFSNRLQVTTVP
jgi:hypothetical protein